MAALKGIKGGKEAELRVLKEARVAKAFKERATKEFRDLKE